MLYAWYMTRMTRSLWLQRYRDSWTGSRFTLQLQPILIRAASIPDNEDNEEIEHDKIKPDETPSTGATGTRLGMYYGYDIPSTRYHILVYDRYGARVHVLEVK